MWATVINALTLVTVQTIFASYTVLLSTVFRGSTLNPWVFALFRGEDPRGLLLMNFFKRQTLPFRCLWWMYSHGCCNSACAPQA